MVKQARAQATRDAIILGAAETFERSGYGLSSIADIATASSVTKGALYFHFQSKDDIARAVIDEQHERAFASGSEIMAKKLPALQTMVLLCAGLAQQLLTDPVVKAGIRLTTDRSGFEQPVNGPYDDWLRAVEDLTVRGIAEGDIVATVDPSMFAHFLIPAFTGVQLVSETLSDRADLLQRVRELWIVLLPGIVPPERYEALSTLPLLVPEG